MTTRRSRPDEVWDFLCEFVAHAAKAHWDLEEEVVGQPMLFWCLCHTGCVPSYYTAKHAKLLRQLADRMGIGWPAVMDRTMTISGIVGGAELRSLELTKDDEQVIIRGILKPSSRRRIDE